MVRKHAAHDYWRRLTEHADLHRFEMGPVLEAEGVAELTPGHELIKELPAAVAAVPDQVSSHLEG